MENRLGIYDILTRLVPGGAFLWALAWLLSLMGLYGAWFGEGSITSAAAYVLLSYVAGLFLDTIGRWTAEEFLFRVFGKPSERFLSDNPHVPNVETAHFRALAVSRGIATAETAQDSHFVCSRVLARYGDKTEKSRAICAQYGIHRTLLGGVFVLLLLSAYGLIWSNLTFVPLVVLTLIGTVFFIALRHWGYIMYKTAFNVMDSEN